MGLSSLRHNKDKATVFNCLFSSPDAKDGYQMSREKLNLRCNRLHSTLSPSNQIENNHPDYDNDKEIEEEKEEEKAYQPVFKTLRDTKRSVLLVAEPQIGKVRSLSLSHSLIALVHLIEVPLFRPALSCLSYDCFMMSISISQRKLALPPTKPQTNPTS